MKSFLAILFVLFCFPAFSQGIITTVAGGGNGGDGSLATNAHLTAPNDVVVDDSGNLYIALETAIRKVDAQTQIISLYAGSYQPGFGCDGCPATQGKLSHASAIAFDPQGNLHIADWGTSRIRKVDALTGMMTTVAGNGSFGYSGDGGAATQAQLSKPVDIAFDGSGNLYIADERYVIRRVDAQTGVITTLAGDGVKGTWNDGDTAVKAQLGALAGICVDGDGNVYFSDASNYKVGKLSGNGVISRICGDGILGNTGDGGLAVNAKIACPTKMKLYKNYLFLTETCYSTIRAIDINTNIITTVAGSNSSGFSGDSGPAIQAQLNGPHGIYIDSTNSLFIADGFNYRIRKVNHITNIIDIEELEFQLYPNPSQGVFQIRCAENIDKVEIFNMAGSSILSLFTNSKDIKVNMSNQPAGIYLVSLVCGKGTGSKKIIIHH